MVTSLDRFVFTSDPGAVRLNEAHVARVGELPPCGPTIFQKLARELRLPDEVDFTWEGLEDGLSDLSWLRARKIAIVHERVPFTDDEALRGYLGALANAVERRRGRDHELVVVFPRAERPRLEKALDAVAHAGAYEAIWG